MKKTICLCFAMTLLFPQVADASKLMGINAIDKDYLMLHFRDGEVRYRDDGTGKSAYLGHSFAAGDGFHFDCPGGRMA